MTDTDQQFLSRRERRAAERAAEAAAAETEPVPPAHGAPPNTGLDTHEAPADIPEPQPEVSPTIPDSPAPSPAQSGSAADVFFQEPAAPAQVLIESAPPSPPASDAAAAFFTAEAQTPASATPPPGPSMPTPPKKPEAPVAAPEPSKGVNLFAAISITAVGVSAVMMFTPPLSFVAAYASYLAVPLALIAIMLPGFKRLQSIVALLLALGLGGWNGYNEFIAPAPADQSSNGDIADPVAGSATPGVYTFLVEGDGVGTVQWTTEGPADDLEAEMPDRELPIRAPIMVEDVHSATVTLTVTAPNAQNVSCAIALGPVDIVAVPANEDGVAVCVVEPRERAADVDEDSGGDPADDLLEQIDG